MERLSVATPQNIDVEFEIAGMGDRLVAVLIDVAAQAAYGFLAGFAASLLVPFSSPWALFTVLSLPIFLYEPVMESLFHGQTLGKMVKDIRVLRVDGGEPSLGSYILRWLIRLVEVTLTLGSVALVTLLINRKGQRLGDIAAGTTVVRQREAPTLEATILAAVPEQYTPQFAAAARLGDRDIELIKEVLAADPEDDVERRVLAESLERKMKRALEGKMGVASDLPARKFLGVVLTDYNYLKGKG